MKNILYTDLSYKHLYIPQSEQASAITVLLLHGTGGDEEDLLPLAQLVCPQANVLSARGDVLENGMNRFFRRFESGTFDQEDLSLRTSALAVFVEEAAAKYAFDISRVVLVGYSNGANIGGSILMRYPDLLAGAALLHAMPPFEPTSLADLTGKPVFVSAGKNDSIVVPTSTRRLIEILTESGAVVTEKWTNGGHGIANDEVIAAADWFRDLALP